MLSINSTGEIMNLSRVGTLVYTLIYLCEKYSAYVHMALRCYLSENKWLSLNLPYYTVEAVKAAYNNLTRIACWKFLELNGISYD